MIRCPFTIEEVCDEPTKMNWVPGDVAVWDHEKISALSPRARASLAPAPVTVLEVLIDHDLDSQRFVWLLVRTASGKEAVYFADWFTKL